MYNHVKQSPKILKGKETINHIPLKSHVMQP